MTWADAAGKAPGALRFVLEKILFKVKVRDRMFLGDHLGFPLFPPDSLPPPPGGTGFRADRLPSALASPVARGLGGRGVQTHFWPAAVLPARASRRAGAAIPWDGRGGSGDAVLPGDRCGSFSHQCCPWRAWSRSGDTSVLVGTPVEFSLSSF